MGTELEVSSTRYQGSTVPGTQDQVPTLLVDPTSNVVLPGSI